MESNRVKSLNTDGRSKKRITFKNSRQRAKKASADVYRSYKRRIGVTTAASREERVHHPNRVESGPNKRQKIDEEEKEEQGESTFASELDVANDRNASEEFRRFYYGAYSLVRSLPELLHHTPRVVELMMEHLLSQVPSSDGVQRFEVNHATTDILHLIGVLARDLRHEIHPYVHKDIVPRIVSNLLNPPAPGSGKQPIPLDVPIVEAAFRCLSYVFRYDADRLVSEAEEGHGPCLESMRQYYGMTLAHRRDLVRRLAAETFAPLIRKLQSDKAKKRHLRRVLRALVESKDTVKSSTQSDAVDGVSLLLFETARGVKGRLHSKGKLVLKCLFEFLVKPGNSDDGLETLYQVGSSFLSLLGRHMDEDNFVVVWDELLDFMSSVLSLKGDKKTPAATEDINFPALKYLVMFLEQSVLLRGGNFLEGQSSDHKGVVPALFKVLEKLLSKTIFPSLTTEVKHATLTLLCSLWKQVPDHPLFSSRGEKLLVSVEWENSEKAGRSPDGIPPPLLLLATQLLPCLPRGHGMKAVGSRILSAAAEVASEDVGGALALVHSVVSVRCQDVADDKNAATETEIFFPENGLYCSLSPDLEDKLLSLCLANVDEDELTRERVAELGVAAKCLPLLTLIGHKDASSTGDTLLSRFKKASTWLLRLLDAMDRKLVGGSEEVGDGDFVVIMSLAVESLSCLSSAVLRHCGDHSSVKKVMVRARPKVLKLLQDNPRSLWVLKCVSAFVRALKQFGIDFTENANSVMETVFPNLRHHNHFLRLHTLQIIQTFPRLPFVTNHAELDLTGDLDEEPSFDPQNAVHRGGKVPVGVCDLIDTLLELEETPLDLVNERRILSGVSKVEALGRTGRLPVLYAEAAANHMLGIMHVKFSSVWPAAVQALSVLASSYEEIVWPGLEDKLLQVTKELPSREEERYDDTYEKPWEAFWPIRHHQLCLTWDATSGKNASMFRNFEAETVQASRHLSTDGGTVFELVWSVMESCPQLATRHSRTVIPLFLHFLHCQYYFFHQRDPDARELRLHEHIADQLCYDRSLLDRRLLEKRLSSFLKMFGAVNGPQQFIKHKLLLSIFLSFLSHQETSIAQMALNCVLKFKLPYLMPQAEYFRNMLKKGELRETLLKFDLSESSAFLREHRKHFIPVLSRVLFGRLLARAPGGRSSKDTPTARRNLVLSFLLRVCESEDELYPFIYLMVRRFLPHDVPLVHLESQDSSAVEEVKEELMRVRAENLDGIPSQFLEGFLNLLEAVISQLGQRAVSFVPHFMTLVLAMCKLAEVNGEEGAGRTLDPATQSTNRLGSIRTLGFQRLSDLFASFSASVDFRPFTSRFWGACGNSVKMLPVTVRNAPRVPALLKLLQTISNDSLLVAMLIENEEAVQSVIKCIDSTSWSPVVNAALTVVDNLLSPSEVANDVSKTELAQKYVSLLLNQLSQRLRKEDGAAAGSDRSSKATSGLATWRRELQLLCRVGELMKHKNLEIDNENEVLERLCDLLLRFLEAKYGTTDEDKLCVLDTMDVLVPRIQPSALASNLSSLARLLGPVKGSPGITSLLIRQRLVAVIKSGSCIEGSSQSQKKVSEALAKLTSTHVKKVDEKDYDSVIPALSALGDKEGAAGWQSLVEEDGMSAELEQCFCLLPLIYLCFHLLYDDDGVITRGAFKALKVLIEVSTEKSKTTPAVACSERNNPTMGNNWLKLLESRIVPLVRSGLSTRRPPVRRYYVLLLAEVARHCETFSSPNLYGDLRCLIRDDDPEVDFFLSITHVQIHRRARALQRLRKLLASPGDTCPFTDQSISNILLPISTHPVYECKAKSEEAFALEAIATVGSLCKFLSWSKYYTLLWSTLSQIQRHVDQERFLIGLVCSIIDGFHFDVSVGESLEESEVQVGNGGEEMLLGARENVINRALEKRLIPKIEGLLVKENIDRHGTKSKSIRPVVVLALLKLFQKLPTSQFESKLPRLLAVICDALKDRDSDARDIAKDTLAKMTVAMDMKYLGDVIKEVAVTLTEGYQVHVRTAAIHSILLRIADSYSPGEHCSDEPTAISPFDECVPALMDLLQQDMFGEAQERREAEGAKLAYVKEAGGSRSVHAIEIICSLIVFRPGLAATGATGENQSTRSAIHAVVSPLLERLRVPNPTPATIRRIKECLHRVVAGLARNDTVAIDKVLPFVYASAEPFIGAQSILSVIDDSDDDDDSDHGTTPHSIQVSGKSKITSAESSDLGRRKQKGTVVEWRPSTLKSAKSSRNAQNDKFAEQKELARVQDGANAPKLTGSLRYNWLSTSSRNALNDPANICAVVFGLNLLHSTLKRNKRKDEHFVAMIDPFVPLLTTCVCYCRDTAVVLLALKTLGMFLRLNLPSTPKCAKSLGRKTLELLSSSGSASNSQHELTQACFKTLTSLMNLESGELETAIGVAEVDDLQGEKIMARNKAIPLDEVQMQLLLSLVQESIVQSDQHNPALGLIKAIVSRRYMSPEFYDLMEKMLELSARSQKPSLRQQSAGIFVQFLLNYPLEKKRIEQHLKQIVLNIKYEHTEGRLSAIHLATLVVDKLPLDVLEEHVQMFFLPFVVQLVNDTSAACKEAIGKCLSHLLLRVSTDVLQSLYDYTVRWSQGKGPLRQTSLEVLGLFAESCDDFLGRGNTALQLMGRLEELLSSSEEWEIQNHALRCVEKLSTNFEKLLLCQTDLWISIAKSMAHSHLSVRKVSTRIIYNHLQSMDCIELNHDSFLVKKPGSIYEIARNVCFQLNFQQDDEYDEELTTLAVKILSWILPVMKKHRSLCYADDPGDRDPILWLMNRLCQIAKPKGNKRREGVFKCFAGFITYCPEIVVDHLELMIEPLHRDVTESSNETENPFVLHKQKQSQAGASILSKEVLHLLEENCDETFMKAYANVKKRAVDKREQRRLISKTEILVDPKAFAERKKQKYEHEKKRRKRRVEERRRDRGATAKRRHLS